MPPRAKFEVSRFRCALARVRGAVVAREIRLNRETNPTLLLLSERLAMASSPLCPASLSLHLRDTRDAANFARRTVPRLPFAHPHLPCSPASSRIRLAP